MAWIPGMLAIILFSAFFFKSDISSFCLSKGIYLFFIVVHQICILNKAGIKLAQT